MSSRGILLTVVLFAIALLFYQILNPLQKKESSQLQEFSMPVSIPVLTPMPAASAPLVFQKKDSENTAKKTPQKTITEVAPTHHDLRKQVRENPHQTPPSMLKFAVALAEKLDEAETSEEAAAKVFMELKDCALNASLLVNVQALCLSNAKRLALKNKHFEVQYQDLRSKANAETVRLSD